MSKKPYVITSHSYNIDPDTKTISITKGFMIEAAKPRTDAADLVLHWNQIYPNFTKVVREGNPNKNSHKGMKESFIMRYISTRTEYETVKNEFQKLKDLHIPKPKTEDELAIMTDEQKKSYRKQYNKDVRAGRMTYMSKLRSEFKKKYPDYSNTTLFLEYISNPPKKEKIAAPTFDIDKTEFPATAKS